MNKRLVLSFHGVGEPRNWSDRAELQHWCSERAFLSILDEIPQVSAELQVPIEITFDDGHASDFELAAPALHKRGLSATFFVCAGRLGVPGYLDTLQMRSLAALGMFIGSHGWDHCDWRAVRAGDAFDREVVQARDAIASALGAGPIEAVAIPFGSYDRRVMTAALRAFSTVYTSDPGLASTGSRMVSRETYRSHEWGADTLRRLASPRPLMSSIRQGLAGVYKRRRGSPA